MGPTLRGGTQVTDFNQGFTKGMFTRNLRRRNQFADANEIRELVLAHIADAFHSCPSYELSRGGGR